MVHFSGRSEYLAIQSRSLITMPVLIVFWLILNYVNVLPKDAECLLFLNLELCLLKSMQCYQKTQNLKRFFQKNICKFALSEF